MAKIKLNEKHILRMSIKRSGNNLKESAEKAGMKRVTLSNQLGREEYNLTLSTMYQILDAIGFEIIVRDKGGKYGGVEYTVKEISEDDPEWIKQAALETAAADIYRRKAKKEKSELSDT